MDKHRTTNISKFLSLVLRHDPAKIGITLDEAGWVGVDELLAAMAQNDFPLQRAELDEVVAGNDKKRFSFSEDGLRIRASQGHSIEVDLGYKPSPAPAVLYHGTVDRFIESIRAQGLIKGERRHVHLSIDIPTAEKVGQRRGRPVILTIDSLQMQTEGLLFFLSDNGVWLTDHVPTRYITFPPR